MLTSKHGSVNPSPATMKCLLLTTIILLCGIFLSSAESDEPASVQKLDGQSDVKFYSETRSSFHRLHSNEGTPDEQEDEEDWLNRILGDNDDEGDDEDEYWNYKNQNKTSPSGQWGRPGNDDNHYDCESMLNYLDQLPPECLDWYNNRPNRPVGSPTKERPIGSPTTEPPIDTIRMDDILVPMSFQVGVRKRLKRRQIVRLRRAVAISVSRILHHKSPFHVPIPIFADDNDSFAGGADRDGETRPSSPPRTQTGPIGRRKQEGGNRGPPGGGRSPFGPGFLDPKYIDPAAYSDEIPDNESTKRSRGSAQKKGNIWLHHYTTNLCGNVTQKETTGRWYYPVEVKYTVFWDVLSYLIEDPRVLANVTRTCWHIGNKTLANGELEKILVEEIINETLFDTIDSNFDGSEDEAEDWTEEEDIFDLDGQTQGDDIPAQNDLGNDVFSTFPNRLVSSTWGKREYFGLYIMIFTLAFAGAMRNGAARNQRQDTTLQLSTNRDILLTEEGVNDILQAGWKYQKKTTGDTSQLYLHVYDKSDVGYSKDNSMLMGGVEQIEIDANKPSTDASPSQNTSTASTEYESNITTNRESRKTSSSRKSGKSSREPPSTTHTASSNSQISEGKRSGSRSRDKGERKRSSKDDRESSSSRQLDSTSTNAPSDADTGDHKNLVDKGRRKSHRRIKSSSSKRLSNN